MPNQKPERSFWIHLHAWAGKFWLKLTEPYYLPVPLEARRKIQLLASLLIIYSLLALIGILASPDGTALYIALPLLFTVILYFLSRTRAYQAIIYITLVYLSAIQYWILFENSQASSFQTELVLVRLVLVFLMGVSLLSLVENMVFFGINFLVISLLPSFRSGMDPIAVFSALGFLLTCAAVLVVTVWHRNLKEQDRRAELLEEKKFSDDLINGLPGIFFMYDPDGWLIRWNKKQEDITGYAGDELSKLKMTDLVDPADHRIILKLLRTVQKNGFGEAEITLVAKSGKRIPFYITAINHSTFDRHYLVGFGIDVSELKRVTEAHRVIVDNSLQGLAILQKGRIVFANRAYANTLHYTVDELYELDPEKVVNLIHVEDRQLLQLRMQTALSGEEVSPEYEIRVVCKDGSIRWLDVTMSLIKFQGQPAIQTATVDISERKLMEVEQARLIWELETKNAELERFTYTVSHDLKSPLITIRGYLGFLEKDVASKNSTRLKADIQRISEATEKMQRLLSDLLALSRVGHITNPYENVPFHEIVEDAAERAGGRIRSRGIRIRIAADLPMVRVDRERIVEVVQNLLDNASKFMGDQADPSIEIGCQGIGQDGKPILFVKDNGMGVDEQFHHRIFGLFNKLNPESEGTGVGLALVKRIIETHEGRIWLDSHPGLGSTFYFTLPVPAKE